MKELTPLAAFALLGHSHHDVDIRFAAVSDPDLLAAQDVLVALELGTSVDVGGVRPGVRLGEGERSEELGAGHCGQILLLLGFGAEMVDDQLG